jgi:cardiolipin synthase
MWLANALTMVRIPLAGVFWLVYGDPVETVAVLAVAGLTDALDGSVARRAKARAEARGLRVSTTGEWLDPLADKVFVLVALAAVVFHEGTPWQLVLLVCTRELVLVPLAVGYRLVARRRIPHAYRADRLGKLTTVAQFVTVAGFVAHARWVPALALVTGALGLTAAVHYAVRTAHAGGDRLDAPPRPWRAA